METPSTDPARLRGWARAVVAPDAEIAGVDRMPGHSGITVGVDVRHGGQLDRLVLRVPPAGVKRAGITDVLRQVPLLQAMRDAGVPVPAVRYWGDDERWFGVPFLAVDRVEGTAPGDVWDHDWAMPAELEGAGEAMMAGAIDALAAIHRVRWPDVLGDWDSPRSSEAEIERCGVLLDRSDPMPWNDDARRLGQTLVARAPAPDEPGIVHGDYYSNNWMFRGRELVAVLDWEGTFIGQRLLDVGWLCMMADPASWHPHHHDRIAWAPRAEAIAERYAQITGADLAALPWYRALSGYRLACLTTYYLSLHRRGRRVDDVWERFAQSAPSLVARGHEVLSAAATP